MLGMIFGVAAVVAMLSIGAGAQQKVMAFIEQLGLPVPSYPVLVVAGALSHAGGDSIALIAAIGAAGVVMGDLLVYAAGACFGRRALSVVCKLSLARDNCVRQTEDKFARFGPWALLFVKFVPGFALVRKKSRPSAA